ncbi:hypothetical protein JXB02_04955 [Candidatus Woesearchaeota archaeon]|nr:hypothetical protein [Candidatus Woesearchaeota archaeon]
MRFVEGDPREDKKRYAMPLLLFAVVVFVVFYAGTTMFGMYRTASNYTEERTEPALRCVGYIYRIENPSYDTQAGTLSFTLYNEAFSDHNLVRITVLSGPVSEEVTMRPLRPGNREPVEVDLPLTDGTFSVYVEDCAEHAKKHTYLI